MDYISNVTTSTCKEETIKNGDSEKWFLTNQSEWTSFKESKSTNLTDTSSYVFSMTRKYSFV